MVKNTNGLSQKHVKYILKQYKTDISPSITIESMKENEAFVLSLFLELNKVNLIANVENRSTDQMKDIAIKSIFFSTDILAGKKITESSYREYIESCLVELRKGQNGIKDFEERILLSTNLSIIRTKMQFSIGNMVEMQKFEKIAENVLREFEELHPMTYDDIWKPDNYSNINRVLSNYCFIGIRNGLKKEFSTIISGINEALRDHDREHKKSLAYNNKNISFQNEATHLEALNSEMFEFLNKTIEGPYISSFQTTVDKSATLRVYRKQVGGDRPLTFAQVC